MSIDIKQTLYHVECEISFMEFSYGSYRGYAPIRACLQNLGVDSAMIGQYIAMIFLNFSSFVITIDFSL